MSAEDYQDAAEKLVNLGLNETQAREIVKVAFHCCVQASRAPTLYRHAPGAPAGPRARRISARGL